MGGGAARSATEELLSNSSPICYFWVGDSGTKADVDLCTCRHINLFVIEIYCSSGGFAIDR